MKVAAVHERGGLEALRVSSRGTAVNKKGDWNENRGEGTRLQREG